MIGMHIVDRDTRATGTQRRNRDIAQPNSLLIYTSIWIVLAKEVPRLVVPRQQAIGIDHLPQGVVGEGTTAGRRPSERDRGHPTAVIVDRGDLPPAQGIFVFDGPAKFVTAGFTIGGVPPKDIRDIPGRIPSPYEGLSIQFAALKLGGATSIGLGQMLGIDASIVGGAGISMVQDVKKECCTQ